MLEQINEACYSSSQIGNYHTGSLSSCVVVNIGSGNGLLPHNTCTNADLSCVTYPGIYFEEICKIQTY